MQFIYVYIYDSRFGGIRDYITSFIGLDIAQLKKAYIDFLYIGIHYYLF